MSKRIVDVLVIDDETLVREMLVDCLSERDISVEEAGDGREGLRKILELEPKVVVSDVRMPHLNGYEILHTVRKSHPNLQSMKFVLLTGLVDTEYASAAFKIGADEYITKPVDTDRFCERVLDLLYPDLSQDSVLPSIPPEGGQRSKDDDPSSSGLVLEEFGRAAFETIDSVPFNVGQIVSIGIDEVRHRVGEDRWNKVKDAVTEQVIRACKALCGGKDTHFRCPDGSVLIVFADDNPEKAQRLANQIIERVNAALFGTADADGVRVESRVERLGVDQAVAGQLTLDQIVEALRPFAVQFGLSNPKHNLKEPVYTEEARPTQSASPAWSKFQSGLKGKLPDLSSALAERVHAFKDRPIGFEFLPIWQISRRQVGVFGCSPCRRNGPVGAKRWNYSVLGSQPQLSEIVELDVAGLEYSLLRIVEHLSEQISVHVSPNIHFETISSRRGRDSIVALLDQIPDEVRDFVSPVVMHVPDGVPEARLTEVLGQIKSRVQFLSVVVPASIDPARVPSVIARYRASGFKYMFIRLDMGSTKLDLKRAETMARTIKSVGGVPGAIGVNTRQLLIELAYSGIEMCGGIAVGRPTSVLPQPYHFDARNLEDNGGK